MCDIMRYKFRNYKKVQDKGVHERTPTTVKGTV